MIDKTSFLENFINAVDFQDSVEMSMDTELANLPEWDSLAALGVIVMFDIEYQKVILGEDLKKCSKIIDLYHLLTE